VDAFVDGEDRLQYLYSIIVDFCPFIMDMYLLARLFVDRGESRKNAWICVGEYHAWIYRDFLSAIGFTTKRLVENIDINDIQITRDSERIAISDFLPWFN
jgi:hypothetical protein